MGRALMAVVMGLLVASVGGSALPEPSIDFSGAGSVALRDADGRMLTLADLRGRIVVLNVWATWCAPCRRELPSLERLARALDGGRYVVALLSVDEDTLRSGEYLRERGILAPALVPAVRAQVMAAFDIRAVPTTLVIAEDGALVARVLGPRVWDSPQIVDELRAIAAGTHALAPPPIVSAAR